MGINIALNFSLGSALPLDDRTVQPDLAARDAIDVGRRYVGLEVYVVSELKKYILKYGTSNFDWVDAGGASTDEDVIVTANGLNKTLKSAIEDGDLGGGGTEVVSVEDSNMIGHFISSNNPLPPQGYISALGKTIGKTGADHNGEDFKTLFFQLWNTPSLNFSFVPPYFLSAAKGGSAQADWDANKRITIDWRDVFPRPMGAARTAGSYQGPGVPNITGTISDVQFNLGGGAVTGVFTKSGLVSNSNSSGGSPSADIAFSAANVSSVYQAGLTETRPMNAATYLYIRYLPGNIQGASAYDIAVRTGQATGMTEAEWLASLQGEPGPESTTPGPAGESAYQTYLRVMGLTEAELDEGTWVLDVNKGDSAYEMAVNLGGFEGDETEFLASTKGSKFVQGPGHPDDHPEITLIDDNDFWKRATYYISTTAPNTLYYRGLSTSWSWAAVANLKGADGASFDLNAEHAFTKQQYIPLTTLTDGASIAWDLSSNPNAIVTLGGSRVLANPTNMRSGADYKLWVLQDATGGRTLTYDTAYKWVGAAPVIAPAANSITIITFTSNGTVMCGVAQPGFA